MAVLTSSGVTFGDSTTINSKYKVIEQTNTPLYFCQNAAPLGWSQDASNGNKMMRVVNGTGGGTGGSNGFTNTFTNRTFNASFNVPFSSSVSGHPLSTPQLPNHTHPINAGNTNAANPSPFGGSKTCRTSGNSTSGSKGNSGSHSHNSSVSASANWSGSIDMSVRYVNVIYCTRD